MSREQATITELTMETASSLAGGSLISVTFNPASVATITSAEQTVTVAGLKTTDRVILAGYTITSGTGLAITGARCSAANTLSLMFTNPTAGAVDASSATVNLLVIRTV